MEMERDLLCFFPLKGKGNLQVVHEIHGSDPRTQAVLLISFRSEVETICFNLIALLGRKLSVKKGRRETAGTQAKTGVNTRHSQSRECYRWLQDAKYDRQD